MREANLDTIQKVIGQVVLLIQLRIHEIQVLRWLKLNLYSYTLLVSKFTPTILIQVCSHA